jgi:hypothetical protein
MEIYLQREWKNGEDIEELLNVDSTSTRVTPKWDERKTACL